MLSWFRTHLPQTRTRRRTKIPKGAGLLFLGYSLTAQVRGHGPVRAFYPSFDRGSVAFPSVPASIIARLDRFIRLPDYQELDCGSLAAFLSGVETSITPPTYSTPAGPEQPVSDLLLNKPGTAIILWRESPEKRSIHLAVYLGEGYFLSKMGPGTCSPIITDRENTIALYDSTHFRVTRPRGSIPPLIYHQS